MTTFVCIALENVDKGQSQDFYRNLQIIGFGTPDFQCFDKVESTGKPFTTLHIQLVTWVIVEKQLTIEP